MSDDVVPLEVLLVRRERLVQVAACDLWQQREVYRFDAPHGRKELLQDPVVAATGILVCGHDLVERREHGNTLYREIAVSLVQRYERRPVLLAYRHAPVGEDRGIPNPRVVRNASIQHRLRDADQEIPEGLCSVCERVLEGLESGTIPGGRRNALLGDYVRGLLLGKPQKRGLFGRDLRGIKRQLFADLAAERGARVAVGAGRRPDPVAPNRAEHPPERLEWIPAILDVDENLAGIRRPENDCHGGYVVRPDLLCHFWPPFLKRAGFPIGISIIEILVYVKLVWNRVFRVQYSNMQRSAFEVLGREVRTKNISERVQRIVLSPIKEMSILADEVHQDTGAAIVSFGQGIPYFDTPEYIKEGIRAALQEKDTARYTLEPGITELRELVAKDLMARKGVENVKFSSEVMISSGCQEAVMCALVTVVDEGDEVLLLSPSFASYSEQILQLGGVPVFVPLDEERGWHLNKEALLEKVSPKTKAILFSHPSNPTGTVFAEEELRILADLAKEHDLVLITDETYDFLVYERKTHVSPASFSDIRDRVILCGSFSKKYALTGYRVGYAFAEQGIMAHMLKVHDALAICAPAISQKAVITALRGDQKSVAEFAEKLTENRELMCKKLDELSEFFEYQKPQGAYYILAKYPSTSLRAGSKSEMGSAELAVKILQEAKVVTIPGVAFGPYGEGHLRFSFACSPEEIEEGFRHLAGWIKNI